MGLKVPPYDAYDASHTASDRKTGQTEKEAGVKNVHAEQMVPFLQLGCGKGIKFQENMYPFYRTLTFTPRAICKSMAEKPTINTGAVFSSLF